MAKPQLASGLSKLREVSGRDVPPPLPVAAQSIVAPGRTATREGLVQIAGHFEKPVRQQFEMMGVQQDRTSQDLLAEALNDLFVKYQQSPIATVLGPGSRSKRRRGA